MPVTEFNHFAVLGLKPGASEDDIRQAYKALARKYHPDKNGGDKKAEEKFKQISNSYEFLQSKDRREMHERDLQNMNIKKEAPKGNNAFFKPQKSNYFETMNGDDDYSDKRPREQEKRRERRRENRRKNPEEKHGFEKSYKTDFPFGKFRSYDEHFHSFFSKKNPFGKDFDIKEYFDEFMKPFKFGGMGSVDPERLIDEFMKPFMFGNIGNIDTRKLFEEFMPSFGHIDKGRFFDEFMTQSPFEDMERMLGDFHPFGIEGRSKRQDIQPLGMRFNLLSPNFTSFYSGEDPFQDF